MGASLSSNASPVDSLGAPLGEETENASYVVRNRNSKDQLLSTLPEAESIKTLYPLFERAAREYGERDCLGVRQAAQDGQAGGSPQSYVFENFTKVGKQIEALGTAMRQVLDLKPGDTAAIFSINRPEWVITMWALWRQGVACVPLYDTLGPSSGKYILNDAEVKVVFSSTDNLPKLLEDMQSLDTIRHVICFDKPSDEDRGKLSEANVKVHIFSDLAAPLSESDVLPPEECEPNTLAYIMYTSGTTGNPKGVRLTHKNVVASVGALKRVISTVGPDDIYLSYLPLAHSFEAVILIALMVSGASVGFYSGDVKRMMDDVAQLRPTVFAGVPRVYSRIYDKVQSTLESSTWVKRRAFDLAFSTQLQHVRNGTRSKVLDRLIFNTMAQRLGGRVRLMATGGAPMAPHLMDFLRVCFRCEVLQGYGLTENMAAACATPPGYMRGNAGEPLPCCEVRLIDVPDLEYFHTDKPYPRGEVCIRGDNVFQGYHNLPDKTKETLDEDGWMHTGDIGQFGADGALEIIDRKKNVFKLAQGEYVAVEELESIFSKSRYISQIWIYGNSYHTDLVAVVVCDPETIMSWCKEHGVRSSEYSEAVKDPKVKEMLLKDLKHIGKEEKLASFKIPKDIIIENEIDDNQQGFNLDNECLTPTQKLRRPKLLERYREQIDAIYGIDSKKPKNKDKAGAASQEGSSAKKEQEGSDAQPQQEQQQEAQQQQGADSHQKGAQQDEKKGASSEQPKEAAEATV